MAKQDVIKRQFLIVEFLRKNPASFKQISNFLLNKQYELDYDLAISQRTFQRDCNEIESLWGVEIAFNKRENHYEIINNENDLHFDRIMEAFDTVAVLQKAKTIGGYLHLEKRKSKGTEYFNGILHAIQNQLVVTFQLKSYWQAASFRRCVPKAIKESQNRYYLIAYDSDKNDFRNFGLDRISDFVITSEKQKTPEINVEAFYQHAFGIECYNDPVEIILEFANDQKKYIQSLPLHASQKIIKENNETFTVALFMHPTNDFVMEIMRYGAICEVIEPPFLRDRIKKEVMQLQEKYQL
ncbi:WYL domain-containing protein [Flavobacterium sp. CBA20B-1]|uniref:helix-turn-helix transcriptional regulator n=1 Tax=unclassified Flavobacterium TaxID=196869 RepID=UPI0022247279|nr:MULTISPECIES: WYL domain-containing protein [unclassified Flavobacterium]WCM41591.1 WYL domain-containing protein [Flavobacterium sp. CBA20B-1]